MTLEVITIVYSILDFMHFKNTKLCMQTLNSKTHVILCKKNTWHLANEKPNMLLTLAFYNTYMSMMSMW